MNDELPREARPSPLGTVAIVGFPNVGKSTLINRLTSSRAAVVHETPRHDARPQGARLRLGRQRFLLIDTGGVDVADDAPSPARRRAGPRGDRGGRPRPARRRRPRRPHAGRRGARPDPRAAHRPVIVLANKIDDPRHEHARARLPPARARRPVPALRRCTAAARATCSTRSSRCSGRGEARAAVGDEAIRVAILGRPNVGKSSLLNALLGARARDRLGAARDDARRDRHLLSAASGRSVLIDTAGLRRKRKHRQGIEYYSELRALEAAERADVALVLIDASEGIVEGDLAVADVARKAQCSTLVVLSKWDLSRSTIEDVAGPSCATAAPAAADRHLSAKTGRGVERLLDKVEELFDKHSGRDHDRRAEPLPRRAEGGAPAAAQGPQAAEPALRRPRSRPARRASAFTVNDPSLVTRDYGYWVENELRERFELEGVPVSIDFAPVVMASSSSAEGRGDGDSRGSFCRPRLRGDARCRDAEDARGDRETGATRGSCPTSTSGVAATTIAEAPSPRPIWWSSRFRAGRSARSSTALPGAPRPQPHERPRPRDRRAALDARHRPPGRGALRPEHGRGDRPRACRPRAVIASEDAASPGQLQVALNSPAFRVYVNDDLDRRRALRRGEERDRARGRRRATVWALGDNAKAALVTRGLAEMARLAEAAAPSRRRSPALPAWETWSSPAGTRPAATAARAS